MSRMAQNAVAKSKEVAEVTRLNVEIGSLQQRVREQCGRLGEYLMAHPELLPEGDETIRQILQAAAECQAKIAQDNQQILEIRNINLCPRCGAEVSRASRFCDKCGAVLERPVIAVPGQEVPAQPEPAAQPEPVQAASAEPVQRFCAQCGSPVEEGALFCGECGARQDEQ